MVEPNARTEASFEGSPVRSLRSGRDFFVSPTEVLHRLHASEGPKPKRRARSDEQTRSALALAMAVGELVRGDELQEEDGETRVVQASVNDLAYRSGAAPVAAEKALEALSSAEVLHIGHTRNQTLRLRLFSEVLGELPGLARLSWGAARKRILREGGSLMPALAVLREIGRDTGPWPADEPAPWIQVFYPRLMETTFYGRTALAQALASLDAAGLIERGEPMQRQPTCRLSRVALGFEPELPLILPPAPAQLQPQRSHEDSQPASSQTGGRVTVQLGNTQIRIPEGAECQIDWDESGDPVLKVIPPRR